MVFQAISWIYKGFHLEVHSGTSISGLLGISREFVRFQGISRDLRNLRDFKIIGILLGISMYFKVF